MPSCATSPAAAVRTFSAWAKRTRRLQVEIYRPGNEIDRFPEPKVAITSDAAALAPVRLQRAEPLASKFGPLSMLTFDTSKGTPRSCLAFVRSYE